MPSLLKDTQCMVCPQQHNFTLPSGRLEIGREYEYVCPETGWKAMLSPCSTGELVHCPPQGAIALVPAVDRSPPLTAPPIPAVEATRLQKVLPEVKDLAGKVGGMDNLAELVDTLKEAQQ